MAVAFFTTKIGQFRIEGDALGISKMQLHQSDQQEDTKKIPEELINCVSQLKEYFSRKRKKFDLKLNWSGATDFNKSVWQTMLEIPYGCTTSYSFIAHKIENPNAVRAVGLASRNNPIAIIVPCHRVIAKSGDLQGYFYGLDIKRQILELENPDSFARQGSLFASN